MISLKALVFLKLIRLIYSGTYVRLTGHNSTFAGRVEVFSNGVWGRVVRSYWDKKEADVVCRQLGFPEAITALRYSAFGEGSGPVVMSGVHCLGTEKTLQQCSSRRNWFVSHSTGGDETGVICKTFNFQLDNNDILIRLQGSTLPYAGRVEVFYAGVWGAISSRNWDINDATVVCRQLGYSAGAEVALKNGVYGPVSGPVWITNLQCTGSESNVVECVHDGLGNKTEWQHRAYTASVICKDSSFNNVMLIRLRGSHSSNMGRIEVHFAGTWGSVHTFGWDIKDTTVACRQLGYQSASLSGGRRFCSYGISTWFTNFRCIGNETSLEQCARDFQRNWPYNINCANVACTDKMTEEDTHVRLTGHNSTFAGRVEVFSHGVWGRVVTFNWDKKEANVVCRQLGFPEAITALPYSEFGEGSGPVVMSDVQCLGTEKTLQQCSYRDWLNSHRTAKFDAGVICKTFNVQPDNNDILIRLQGSTLPYAGRVEVFYAGVWGAISSSNWDENDATVVCRQLGYSVGAEVALKNDVYGLVSGPVWITNLQCTGSESNVMECVHDGLGNKTELQRRGNIASVICKDSSFTNDILIRLQGSTLPYAGRIEVFYAGVWGAISSSNWDKSDATVVCRQLGYSAGAEVALKNDVYGLVSSPVWITNLQCTGSESNVTECPHDGFGTKTEIQRRDRTASVICKDLSFPNVMPIRLRGSHSSNMGRIEIHFAGTWGSVSKSGWDIKDATVACRQLGYHSASLSGHKLFCSYDVPMWFINFRCIGNETSLEQCARDFYRNWAYNINCANVACTDKMTEEGPELRLSGSPVPYAGRVELRYKGIWGTISHTDFFFYRDRLVRSVRVICRQLGFADAVFFPGSSVYGPGSGPVWLDIYHLRGCLGHERNILNCSSISPRFTVDNHQHDLSVVCKPNASHTSDFQVRLNGSSLSSAGTINVLYYGTWGGIPGDNVDLRVGHVVCRQLGYAGAEQIFAYPLFGRVIGPMLIRSIQCNGNEPEISQCKVETWDKVWNTSWYHLRYYYYNRYYRARPRYEASLLCSKENSSVSKVLNVRLSGAPISNAGRVDLLYAGLWGTITSRNWDINDGHVVCRQLGYTGAISFGSSNQFGIGNGPSWFQNVRCLGNESSFEECSKDVLGFPKGYYISVATVLCKSKPKPDPNSVCGWCLYRCVADDKTEIMEKACKTECQRYCEK